MLEINSLNWKKVNGMIPVIIQHFESAEILMHAYMNKIALEKTIKENEVTFFSRTKKVLWKKGMTSGNILKVIRIIKDCDNDCLLILVDPYGPTCHIGKKSCFSKNYEFFWSFIYQLEAIIRDKKYLHNKESYTFKLYKNGIKRVAQKVGEEAIETILSSLTKNNDELINESSDLIYHLLVLLSIKNIKFKQIIYKLKERNKDSTKVH